MEPIRLETRVLHGQLVTVKVYPPQKYVPSPITRGCGWTALHIPTIAAVELEDPESPCSKQERERDGDVDPNDYEPEDLTVNQWDKTVMIISQEQSDKEAS